MQQQPDHNQTYNDEIDLADLVRSLWNGKWLVMGVAFFTVVLAVAYLVFVPKTYTGSLEIAPISTAEADSYAALHETEMMALDDQVLLALFVKDLQSNKYSLVSSDPSHWVLRFTTKNPEASSITLAAALERSNNNVNEQIAQTFESRFDAQRRNNNLAIEGLEEDKQKAIFDYNAANEVTLALLEEKMQILRSGYDAVKSAKLVMLAEQAQIARSLNLDKGAHATLEFANEGTTYLRGYLPIEQEITLIKSQSSPELLMLDYAMLAKEYALLKSRAPLELFIPELARIEWSIQQLLLNRVLKNAEALLTSTPIGTDQFNSAVYDLASIEYQSKTKSALILSLALVLGGMLGIFVLLIRNALIKSE